MKLGVRDIYLRIKSLGLRNNMEFTSEVPNAKDYYRILVATILSQNTNDRNSIRAFKNLDRLVGVEPEKILKADPDRIADAIRIGGLHNTKARKIKEATKLIMNLFDGDLTQIIDMDYQEARKKLLSIPGIGDKTADILLLKAGHPAFPVDTHISRITKRLGLVKKGAGYGEISRVWREALSPEEYLDAHLNLIAFGRKICRAVNPKCTECPINNVCKYYGEKIGKENSAQ